ncbi:MAG: hypothetical protein COV67_07555 [Nitrospinae bacterium CG11_big_fil_rev_8_21_14_0_20_56_8]|nr:MAG: hypothetical protein COV67_07555 [Nitrospinae bacterium CG11_big_fil_rev_8_21_14_0_20_56_8]
MPETLAQLEFTNPARSFARTQDDIFVVSQQPANSGNAKGPSKIKPGDALKLETFQEFGESGSLCLVFKMRNSMYI